MAGKQAKNLIGCIVENETFFLVICEKVCYNTVGFWHVGGGITPFGQFGDVLFAALNITAM